MIKGAFKLVKNNFLKVKKSNIDENLTRYRDILLKDINLKAYLMINGQSYITELESWENNHLLLAAPISTKISNKVPSNSTIKVQFITASSPYIAHVKVLHCLQRNGIHYYHCQLLQPLIREQNRQAFRLPILLDVHYKLLAEDNTDSPALEYYPGTFTNISIGGASMLCTQKLEEDTLVHLHFNLLETDLKFTGKILTIDSPNRKGLFPHHIQFMNLTSADENSLNRLIMKKQRLTRQLANAY